MISQKLRIFEMKRLRSAAIVSLMLSFEAAAYERISLHLKCDGNGRAIGPNFGGEQKFTFSEIIQIDDNKLATKSGTRILTVTENKISHVESDGDNVQYLFEIDRRTGRLIWIIRSTDGKSVFDIDAQCQKTSAKNKLF